MTDLGISYLLPQRGAWACGATGEASPLVAGRGVRVAAEHMYSPENDKSTASTWDGSSEH